MGGHSDSSLFAGVLANRQAVAKIEPELDSGGSSPDNTTSEAPAQPESTRSELMSQATTDQVKRIVGELYRPGAEEGDGGTADAIRKQLRTGQLVGGRDHIRKGRERLRQIKKLLSRFPDHPDRGLLERLRSDLEDALGGTK
ncbi:MAG: hypothetical protein Q4D06_00680 [Coriobacteriia bacterium]|nr:hypothetical protein [Coriobacteriia bacterium]